MFLNLFLVVLLLCFSNIDGKCKRENFGTVLFSESDLRRTCYGQDEVAMITARMMLQDLIPNNEEPVIENNEYVQHVIEYFRLILEVVREKMTGKGRHVMLLALTDTLGGYMHKSLLPVAKCAYYAGKINYASVIQLYELYGELKSFLRTSGLGWASPSSASCNVPAERLDVPLPMSRSSCGDPCKGLIFYKHFGDEESTANQESSTTINIPMPFFDSKSHPSAMAVPFKTYSLRNVESKSAAYILVKYYVAGRKCLAALNANEKSVNTFLSDFYSFLNRKVVPHLTDDRFYAGFGGVLRLTETLKHDGVTPSSESEYNSHILGFHEAATASAIESEAAEGDVGTKSANEAEYAGSKEESKKKKSNLILFAALVTIFFWFLIGAFFICCKMRAAKNKNQERQMSDESDSKHSLNSSCVCPSHATNKLKSWGGFSSKSSTPSKNSSAKTKQSHFPKGRSVSDGAVLNGSQKTDSPQRGDETRTTSSEKSFAWKNCFKRGSKDPSERGRKSRRPSSASSGNSRGDTTKRGSVVPSSGETQGQTSSKSGATGTEASSDQETRSTVTTTDTTKPSSFFSKLGSSGNKSRSGSKSPKSSSKCHCTKEDSSTMDDTDEEFATGSQIDPRQYYNANFACHTSLTGKYQVGSAISTKDTRTTSQANESYDKNRTFAPQEFSANSTKIESEDTTSRYTGQRSGSPQKAPFVFGYDYNTTSTSEDTTPRTENDRKTVSQIGEEEDNETRTTRS